MINTLTTDERYALALLVVARMHERGCYGTLSMDTIYTAIDVTLGYLDIEVRDDDALPDRR